jgi:dsRNA-specific ribonuclease
VTPKVPTPSPESPSATTNHPTGRKRSKGQWDNLRQQNLSNENLAQLGFDIGIDDCILRGAGLPAATPKMVYKTVEAIFGAVFADADALPGVDGQDALRGVLVHWGLDR